MLNTYYTEKLLGLKEAILLNSYDSDGCKVIEIKMKQRIHVCPKCHAETSRVHDYRIQNVKDIPMFFRLVKQMAEREGVTEQVKADNQREWVGRMNNIRSRATEIVNHDIIYS